MKNIWIFNHYAGPPSITTGLRHFNFAKYLIRNGYKVIIFASSVQHNFGINMIKDKESYMRYEEEGIPFVFINTRQYNDNGKKRVENMMDYYRGLFKATKEFEKPDIIIGSSVHPLACLAAIKVSKKYQCRNIIEVRDLWPESLVEHGSIKDDSFFTKILYLGEKWIYKKAHSIIFTMKGGKDYILEKGWDKVVDLNKVYHINNGVDLEMYKQNIREYSINDLDLNSKETFKVIYVGSIRSNNNLEIMVDVAEKLKKYHDIKILIYGDGNEKERLEKLCTQKKLNNIIFKGFVKKNYVPYILSQGDLNILHGVSGKIGRYGISLNKSFDYLASKKPILSDILCAYDYIIENNCGVVVESDSDSISKGIISFYKMPKTEYEIYSKNEQRVIKQYDFKELTKKLINIIEREV